MTAVLKERTEVSTCRLGGTVLAYSFRYPETENYFRRFRSEQAGGVCISVGEQEFLDWQREGNEIDAFAEFCLSCMPTSEALLDYDRCVFHAAAVRKGGKAWLIAAGSGVGKSTQCRTLLELWPEEFSVINGDKPVLEARKDGTVMVHPSPWNGKEGLRGAEAAPLAGIIVLSRGEEDRIREITAEQAALPVFGSIFQKYEDPAVIRKAADLAERIILSCRTWHLVSENVPESTRLLYEMITNTDNAQLGESNEL